MNLTSKAAIALGALAVLAIPQAPLAAQDSEQSAQGPYSVAETPVGTLLDDPEASAILEKLIPTVFANEMFQTMGRNQTLKAIQQYEPASLTDEKLAEIQAAFDQLNQS
ncbi:hypothetical protein WYH_00314 [Croceibacterium atlanticum]|uniref:Uncharacterized protein n=2 Tax=Croceibacterium atlanticum TaxID=1267766 RepID=A0A0F7KQG6_9SPHN|nr:hypothetical protein [Croceibacterium atlanticum]AKH41377.1 hypothetical protein WYH_00314 [Croceibacterium atlanticum]